MLSIIFVPPILLLLYLFSFLVTLLKNYLAARNCGLPIIIVPIHPNHLIWMVIGIPLRPWLKRHLPYSLYSRVAVSIYGWEYHEKRIMFHRLQSDSFMLVTCGKNEVWTIDSEIVADVLKRPTEFSRTEIGNQVLDVFGTSVLTSTGDAWTRQRSLITRIINERISKIVFDEAWKQTRDMLIDVEKTGIEGSTATKSGDDDAHKKKRLVYPGTFASMKRIASNVLFRSAYGTPQEFKQLPEKESADQTEDVMGPNLSMLDCIQAIIQDLVPAAILSQRILAEWPSFLPGSTWARRLGAAKDQFPKHVKKRLQSERDLLKDTTNVEVRNNLTSMLIQASENGEVGAVALQMKNGKPQRMLSESELRGNLFIFTAAGYETTATALTFALVALMAEPGLQDWLFEEIDMLFEKAKRSNEAGDKDQVVDYVAFHPKALRCLALMMEVLRIYSPVIHMDRQTLRSSAETTLKTNGKTYRIPVNCHIFAPMSPLHTNPKVWRNLNLAEDARSPEELVETLEDVFEMTKDEYNFRPARWINEQTTSNSAGSVTKTLFQPPKGSFIPFSGGPRVCPGQKMAQVEFVCVILALFKDYRIEAVRLPGEEKVHVRRRLEQILKDCHAEMTLVMERLHEVEVQFVKRNQ